MTTPKSRIHGRSPENLHFDKDALLAEARTWSEDEMINWTQVAKRYGVDGSNGIVAKFRNVNIGTST